MSIAFSCLADGDQREEGRRSRFTARHLAGQRLVVPRQVHGTVVCAADAPDLSQADGVVSDDPAVALGVYGADCPGVVIAAPDALGAAHCGWRGTAGGMVRNLVAALAGRSRCPRSTWSAFIGPGIGGSRYEVDAVVIEARPWPARAVVPSDRAGRWQLDLPTALESDLQEQGILRIRRCGVCTASDPRLHSYRHRGPGLVQLLLAWREPT